MGIQEEQVLAQLSGHREAFHHSETLVFVPPILWAHYLPSYTYYLGGGVCSETPKMPNTIHNI